MTRGLQITATGGYVRRASVLLGIFAAAAFGSGVLVSAASAQSGSMSAPTAPTAPTPAPVATLAPLHTTLVDGATIAYRDLNPSAKGTPLLLIVGFGSTMAEWDPALVARLAAHRRLIMFDNRGIGDSTGAVGGLTVTEMATDATGLIRALGLGRTDVLGWSMGGFIAQRLAIEHPGLVRRLILASTDPGSAHTVPGKPAAIDVLTNPATTPTQLLPILFPANQLAAGGAWLQAIGTQPGIMHADFAAPPATLAAQTLATTTRWLGKGEGTYARLADLRAPTLVAYGAGDVIVPPTDDRLLLRRIPRAIGMRVSDAGHAFLFQNPTAAGAAFAHFLDTGHKA
jgi:pimeloyl-ACP methyl ester carboxylesterase